MTDTTCKRLARRIYQLPQGADAWEAIKTYAPLAEDKAELAKFARSVAITLISFADGLTT